MVFVIYQGGCNQLHYGYTLPVLNNNVKNGNLMPLIDEIAAITKAANE